MRRTAIAASGAVPTRPVRNVTAVRRGRPLAPKPEVNAIDPARIVHTCLGNERCTTFSSMMAMGT